MNLLKKDNAVQLLARYSIFLITVVFMIICSFLNSNFLTAGNLTNILRQITVYAVMAFGQTILIISGNIDLAAGSTCCFSGLIGLDVYVATSSFLLAILAAMLSGALVNLVSGLVVTIFNLPAFVATLGMQMAVRGLCYLVTGGGYISNTGENFRFLGQGYVLGFIPLPVLIMLVSGVILWFLMERTVVGRRFFAMGGNREAARAAGIDPKKYTILAFFLSGLFIGLGGILFTSRANVGQPGAATGYEGQAISATVIGGIGFAGGSGSAWGALLGAIVIGIMNNILNLLGVDSYIQQIVSGIIIVFAVGLDTYSRARRVSK